jgi:hypothetical protein
LQPLFLLTDAWLVGHQLLLPLFVTVQMPATQVVPVQSVQMKPEMPHWVVVLPGWQVPFRNELQQPVGQVFWLQ